VHRFEGETAQALKDENEARAIFEEIGDKTKAAHVDLNLAELFLDEGKSAQAAASARHAAEVRALLKLDRPAEPVKDLEAAERADPAEASTHFLLGQAYRALGKTAEAQAEMNIFSQLEESARAKTAERAKQILDGKKQRALETCAELRVLAR
jgi:predicted Zn-dependent protease